MSAPVRRGRLDRLIAWSPVLLLGALAAFTYWLSTQVRAPAPAFDGSNRHDPDIVVENFRATNLDAGGRVRQALEAKRAQHFPDDDTTLLDQPSVTFTDPDQPRMNVVSQEGRITGDREHAYFSGHVRAVRDPTPGKNDGPVTFASEYLHVLPRQDRVESDRPVTITDPRGIINAASMVYDNKSRTVTFRSRVTGQFLPEH